MYPIFICLCVLQVLTHAIFDTLCISKMASFSSKITNFCPVFRYILQQQKNETIFCKTVGSIPFKMFKEHKKKNFMQIREVDTEQSCTP